MRQHLKQKKGNPVHCVLCIQTGAKTPATWQVLGALGAKSLAACDDHVDIIEQQGVHAVAPKKRPL